MSGSARSSGWIPSRTGARGGAGRGLTTTGDLQEALDDPRIDAVVLCSPHRFHADQIVAAAEAGKHVFCEKPFCTTADDDGRRRRGAWRPPASRSASGTSGASSRRSWSCRTAVRSGELGVPLVFEGNFSQDKFLALPAGQLAAVAAPRRPVGPLSATGIHLVDLAISILGEPAEVWARLSTRATTFGNGDTLSVTLGFAERRDRQHHRHPDHAVHRPDLRPGLGGLDGDPRPHASRASRPAGTSRRSAAAASARSGSSPPNAAVRDNLECFAERVAGGAPTRSPPAEIRRQRARLRGHHPVGAERRRRAAGLTVRRWPRPTGRRPDHVVDHMAGP